jgi:hypothetical protein
MKETMMIQSIGFTSQRGLRQLLGALLASLSLSAVAAEAMAPLPVVVAESEAFEVVGRLAGEGLVLHVDRAPDNEPVLAATLEIESGGRSVTAAFRPASGDYLVADAGWLQPLREPGEHPLALTLLAGDDSDLLSGELIVSAAPPAASAAGAGRLGLVLLAVLLLVAIIVIGRRLRANSGGVA